ncbi:hypothetical protein OPT61_g828 [Boeremia exigua]|uniref:Uncharacterized protein n=1 Tax=Boeremia exigua TaxID=749465 RepID=A0ACC2ISH4_9PLEO|nr:hypothetical protein OPT61_g828 [Boeremia exigua]
MTDNRRSVLITGCTKGSAGHALALEFASRGLKVFATARSLSSLEGLSEKGIETLTLDVTSSDSISALRREIETRNGGKLDILFNNAGLMYQAPAIDSDPHRVQEMFNANVFGVFNMVTAFTPLLLAARSNAAQPPTIINTASVLAFMPNIFSAPYNASKAAVSAYSDTLRLELAPLGIKVVTLYMGIVSTGITSPDAVAIEPTSFYSSLEGAFKKRSQEHLADGMTPQQFAKEVVNEVLVKKPNLSQGEYVWKGSKALLVWLLHTVGGRKIFDSTSEGSVGLDAAAKKKIAEKAAKSSL